MTIPFLSMFKKKGPKAEAAPVPPPVAVEKPSSERMSKTVMPNATRAVPQASNGQFGGNGGSYPPAATVSAGQRTVSFATSATRSSDLPPALALALEPRVERAISLKLGEVVAQMPPGFVRELANGDSERNVLLKAAELERGMANGKPAVSIATIYQQLPDIFLRPVEPSDPTQVQLPFQRVLEQFTNLQVRADQQRDHVVPQVETPFLRVTLEDDAKFGTSIGPVQTAPMPSVRMEPATAKTIAAAEPEPAAQEIYTSLPPTARIRLPLEAATAPAVERSNPEAPVEKPAAAGPTRIPFKLSPKGPDAPATEVPASGGPSVPTSLAPADAPAAPTRIPFKMTPVDPDAPRPSAEPWLTKESFGDGISQAEPERPMAAPLAEEKSSETMIALLLKPIMQTLTPFQIIGDVNAIPEEAQIELPFSMVEPQLASGRVNITPEQFGAHLPAAFRSMFDVTASAGVVALPLHEILKNLPAASLRMRDDQVEQEQGIDFVTPFSAKAEEDAKRFKVTAPVPKPVVLPEPKSEPVVAIETPAPELHVLPPAAKNGASANGHSHPVTSDRTVEPAPEPRVARTPLQVALGTDGEIDAKSVVAHVEQMAGVEACAIMFGDGLSLAGNLPAEYEADGLCAMAPSLLQRIENHMEETDLGALRSMTISCARASVTFLMHENLCLLALHTKEELAAEVRERLSEAVHELSKKYSHPC